MSHDRLLELANGSVDGSLDQAGRAELSTLLLADAEHRRLHDELLATCKALETLPSEPVPEGFADAVLKRAESAGVLAAPGISGSNVFQHNARSAGSHSAKEFHMPKSSTPNFRKVAMVAGFLGVVGAVGFVANQYAPSSSSLDAAGTIVAAKRFQNNQVSAGDIEGEGSGSTGSETGAGLDSAGGRNDNGAVVAGRDSAVVAGRDSAVVAGRDHN